MKELINHLTALAVAVFTSLGAIPSIAPGTPTSPHTTLPFPPLTLETIFNQKEEVIDSMKNESVRLEAVL